MFIISVESLNALTISCINSQSEKANGSHMTGSLSFGLVFAWLFIPGLPSSVSMAYLHRSVEEAVSHHNSF